LWRELKSYQKIALLTERKKEQARLQVRFLALRMFLALLMLNHLRKIEQSIDQARGGGGSLAAAVTAEAWQQGRGDGHRGSRAAAIARRRR
jgi:hypothetical protein